MQKLYTLTSDEVESLSFYQQSIRTTASNIGKLIDKIEDGETHTEKIKYKIDEIISYTKHINDILAEKWNDDLLGKEKTNMKNGTHVNVTKVDEITAHRLLNELYQKSKKENNGKVNIRKIEDNHIAETVERY